MLKKSAKKFLSIAMALTVIAACFLPSFAEAGKCSCGENPMLIISGFSQYQLINYKTGKSAWAPETDKIVNAVTAVLPSLTKFLASEQKQSDCDALCDVLIPEVNKVLDDIAVLPDGTPKYSEVALKAQFTESVAYYGIETVMGDGLFGNDIVKTASNAVGADHVWVYGLDWRVDPMVLADEIHDYVERIVKTSGHDKVSISGISMGGVIMTAYLAKYGTEHLSNITMLSSAFTGLDMIGQLFTGNIEIDEQGLYNIITQAVGNSAISDVLNSTGILKKLIPVLDTLVKFDKDRIYSECLIPNFGYNTGMWGFVPDSYFAEAKKFMNARMNDGTPEQTQIFWQRVNDYHNNAQNKICEILNTAKADGICVAVISNYNMQIAPITPSGKLSSDQVIETIHTSGYATVADLGETLGDNYPRNAYLSEDRIIDASTCYLPDNTWFIKNQQHVGFSEEGPQDNGAFYAWILTAKTQYDVFTNAKYPQFMVYDAEANRLSPLSNIQGDASSDGQVSIVDAKLVLEYAAGFDNLTCSELWAADMNLDGSVTVADAKLILQKIASV